MTMQARLIYILSALAFFLLFLGVLLLPMTGQAYFTVNVGYGNYGVSFYSAAPASWYSYPLWNYGFYSFPRYRQPDLTITPPVYSAYQNAAIQLGEAKKMAYFQKKLAQADTLIPSPVPPKTETPLAAPDIKLKSKTEL